MIPKVNKALLDPEIIADEQLYKARPEWFKFFYAAWFISTQSMDDMQRGWYIQLLTWAATEGDPPGYLPANDHELKHIAGMDALPGWLSTLVASGVDVPQPLIKQIINERELKWRKVRKKFIPLPEDRDLVYNPRLLRALRDAYRYRERASEIGKLGGQTRWAKNRKKEAKTSEKRGLIAETRKNAPEAPNSAKKAAQIESPKISQSQVDDSTQMPRNKDLEANAISENASADPMPGKLLHDNEVKALGNTLGNTNNKISLSLPLRSALSLEEDPEEEVEDLVLSLVDIERDPEETNELSTKGKRSRSLRKRRSGESIFDDKKWEVTTRMSAHLLTKYQEEGIEQGDIDYLGEKFSLVHHNSRYSSWSRAFFNFVDNQLTKYGYTFGAYKRRGRKHEQPRTEPGSQPNRKPWESAIDKSDRLDSEAEELARRLRGGSAGDHQVGTPGRALAADFDE